MLHRFLNEPSGSIIPTFALAIIPVIGMVGAAVDYSRANSARTAMQSALDSTALMLSREAPNLTEAQLKQKATAYFSAMYLHKDVQAVTVTPKYTSQQAGSFKLEISGTGKVETTFSRVLGQNEIAIGAGSEVVWGIKKLEVALALDNTGSMAWSNKMTELKKAAKSLLDTLQTAQKTPGDIKVAIIPFDTSVKIGTTFKNENWFDKDEYEKNFKKNWDGCVRDRTQPYDVQDTVPTPSNKATLFPAHECDSLVTAMPLSYDWTALKNKIDSMVPNGWTNVTIGLVWAWHALTASAPYTEAAAPATDLDKVIILLTDGDNTRAWDNANNDEITSQSAIDARTAAACSNIKAANIKIYAVRVIEGNANLLKNCATNPTMYYDVSSASQLNAVFTTIAQSLANLRVSK